MLFWPVTSYGSPVMFRNIAGAGRLQEKVSPLMQIIWVLLSFLVSLGSSFLTHGGRVGMASCFLSSQCPRSPPPQNQIYYTNGRGMNCGDIVYVRVGHSMFSFSLKLLDSKLQTWILRISTNTLTKGVPYLCVCKSG